MLVVVESHCVELQIVESSRTVGERFVNPKFRPNTCIHKVHAIIRVQSIMINRGRLITVRYVCVEELPDVATNESTAASKVNALTLDPTIFARVTMLSRPSPDPLPLEHESIVVDVHVIVEQIVLPNVAVGVRFTPPKFIPEVVIETEPLSTALSVVVQVTTGPSYVNSITKDPTKFETVTKLETSIPPLNAGLHNTIV
jgi:hypothetical protein